MQNVRSVALLGLILSSGTLVVGCGESESKPVMVVPDTPPAVQGKSSMDAYLQANPKAAKKAGPGMAPTK